MYVKIQDKDGLVRDMSSGAILNNNTADYESYLVRKKRAELSRIETQRQVQEINNIKDELSEIKQMLLTLMNKE